MPIRIDVLMMPGCDNGARTLELVRSILSGSSLDVAVEAILVATAEDAEREGFLGSPSVRVDGVDIDPERPTKVGLG